MSRQWKTPYRDPNYYGTAMTRSAIAESTDKYRVLKKKSAKQFHSRNKRHANRRKSTKAIEFHRRQLENNPVAAAQRAAFLARHQPPAVGSILDIIGCNFTSVRNDAPQHCCATTQQALVAQGTVGLNPDMPEIMEKSPPSHPVRAERLSGDQRNTPGSRWGSNGTGTNDVKTDLRPKLLIA